MVASNQTLPLIRETRLPHLETGNPNWVISLHQQPSPPHQQFNSQQLISKTTLEISTTLSRRWDFIGKCHLCLWVWNDVCNLPPLQRQIQRVPLQQLLGLTDTLRCPTTRIFIESIHSILQPSGTDAHHTANVQLLNCGGSQSQSLLWHWLSGIYQLAAEVKSFLTLITFVFKVTLLLFRPQIFGFWKCESKEWFSPRPKRRGDFPSR